MKSLQIDYLEINEKPIYIFENHSLAFKAWLDIKNGIDIQPFVITLDHHTDTRKPLCNFGVKEKMQSQEIISFEEFYKKTLEMHFESFNISNENEVDDFLVKLHHDEHISSAIQKGIISHSISIQWDDNSGTKSIEEAEYDNQPTQRDLYIKFGLEEGEKKYSDLKPAPIPPFSYELPENRMFIVGPSHFDRLSTDDGIYDLALEDEFLENQFNIVKNMHENSGLPDIGSGGYILDIDLDYFHTQKSISPDSQVFFNNLVKNSVAITIAKESRCVLDLRADDEQITSESLLKDLQENIKRILCS